jgi:hypothetical protein
MSNYFFGYGSLVNQRTHTYEDCRPATVRGWQRSWFPSARRDVSFLSAVPDSGGVLQLQGLIASVPQGNWSALDLREQAYFRSPIEHGTLTCDLSQPPVVQIYQANPDYVDPVVSRKPILLSYLDVVVQGYLRVFGQAGVESFFATTLGWDTPIRDDRAAPVYTRAQSLSRAETALVDRHLTEVSAVAEPAQVTVSTG